ncbi:unnamed protein product [Meloidogyne enterolobii]|uniref:Uncharacterized protein n=1 Tax=Meloidogyne enterolobii TaxID=390850 RepID=A0ACB0ZKV7_MELEN
MSQTNSPSLAKPEQNEIEIVMEKSNENPQIITLGDGLSSEKLVGKKNSVKKSEPNVSARGKTLWKLVRMKYIPRLEFRLCRTCSNVLFHSTSRIVEKPDGGVKIMFELCDQCVQLNMHVKDVLCEWVIKKKEYEKTI